MKVIAYVALLYGSDYLGYAIRSVIESVDELHVLYSPHGSHGHVTALPCPDNRDTLHAIAAAAAADKLRWHDGDWQYENEQRESIYQYAPDADVILVLDADEIWGTGLADNAVKWCSQGNARYTRLPFVHYWRSFHHAVLRDPAYPVRVIVPQFQDGERTLTDSRTASNYSWIERPENGYWINHFGYAQRVEIVRYKLETHGHKAQFRTDVDWFTERFLNVRQCTDLHPVGSEYWNIEDVNPWDYMPEFMKQHPYARLAIIE